MWAGKEGKEWLGGCCIEGPERNKQRRKFYPTLLMKGVLCFYSLTTLIVQIMQRVDKIMQRLDSQDGICP